MCGVIGYWPRNPTVHAAPAFNELFEQSRVRGQHAYGLSQLHTGSRQPTVFRSFDWQDIPQRFVPTLPAIAHTRYCQSGDWSVLENNQPILVDNMALAMNGVIHMGTKAEYEAAFDVTCAVDNDSEIFLRRLEQGRAAEQFIAEMTGSFAAVWLKDGRLHAGRNARRPLWRCEAYGATWYASTGDIFRRAGFPAAHEVSVGVEVA